MKNLKYSSQWFTPQSIEDYPEYHSNSRDGNIIPILILVEWNPYPVIGHYYAGLLGEFRANGSPSEQFPSLWTPLPPIPTKSS